MLLKVAHQKLWVSDQLLPFLNCCKKPEWKLVILISGKLMKPLPLKLLTLLKVWVFQRINSIQKVVLLPWDILSVVLVIFLSYFLGSRQIATLLPELLRQNKKYGVVSMCIGTGMGAAALIEREWWSLSL